VAIRPNFTPIKESTTITAVYFMDELIAFFRMLFGLKPSVERIQSKCNHVFAPEKDESGKFIGQRCPICDKFNSMKDLGMEEDDT
jgi:phage FluMu protein Com